MTDLKYSILGVLYSNEPRQESQTNLIKRHFDTPASTSHAIDELIEAKLIKPILGSDKVELTPSGANVYESAQEVRYQQAEDKKQQRFNNKISVASVLVSTITFILGLVVESYAHIVDWFIALFT